MRSPTMLYLRRSLTFAIINQGVVFASGLVSAPPAVKRLEVISYAYPNKLSSSMTILRD
jgi:hypothetical protein